MVRTIPLLGPRTRASCPSVLRCWSSLASVLVTPSSLGRKFSRIQVGGRDSLSQSNRTQYGWARTCHDGDLEFATTASSSAVGANDVRKVFAGRVHLHCNWNWQNRSRVGLDKRTATAWLGSDWLASTKEACGMRKPRAYLVSVPPPPMPTRHGKSTRWRPNAHQVPCLWVGKAPVRSLIGSLRIKFPGAHVRVCLAAAFSSLFVRVTSGFPKRLFRA
jgi:hypothetical protein